MFLILGLWQSYDPGNNEGHPDDRIQEGEGARIARRNNLALAGIVVAAFMAVAEPQDLEVFGVTANGTMGVLTACIIALACHAYRRDPSPGRIGPIAGIPAPPESRFSAGLRAAAACKPLIPLMFPRVSASFHEFPPKLADSRERSSRETSPSTTQSTANRRPNECLRETRGSLRGAGPGSPVGRRERVSRARNGRCGAKVSDGLFDVQTTGSGAAIVSGDGVEAC